MPRRNPPPSGRPESPAIPPALNPTTGSPFPPLGLSAALAASDPARARRSADTPPAVNRWATALPSSIGAAAAAKDHSHAHDAIASHHGLPPPPPQIDLSQALRIRLQDAVWSDEEEEEMECPLCLEEIDITDSNFKPCPCGYRICRFCWHNIMQNFNGLCPACRRKYSEDQVEFTPMSNEEIKQLSQAKKQREREKKELEQMNRTRLANSRIVQRNLVYVTGLSSKLATEDLIPTLKSHDYFGQYGRITHIEISRRQSKSKLVMGTQDTSIGVYVTYQRREDAARTIVSIDGTKSADGKTIHASYGTNKYCTTYLRNLPCHKMDCTLIHEPADEMDTFTKDDLHHLRPPASDTDKVRTVVTPSKQEMLTSWGAPIDRPPAPPPAHLPAPPTPAAILQAAHQAQGHSLHAHSHSPHPPAHLHAHSHTHESESGGTALPKTASWGSVGGLPVRPAVNGVTTPGGLRQEELPPLSAALAHSQAAQATAQQPKKQRAPKKEAGKADASGKAPVLASPNLQKEDAVPAHKPTIADMVNVKNSPKPSAAAAQSPGPALPSDAAAPAPAESAEGNQVAGVRTTPLTKDELRAGRMPLDVDVGETVEALVSCFTGDDDDLSFSLDEQQRQETLATKDDLTNIAVSSSWHAIGLAALGIGTIAGFGSLSALSSALHVGPTALDQAASSLLVESGPMGAAHVSYRGRFDPYASLVWGKLESKEAERRSRLMMGKDEADAPGALGVDPATSRVMSGLYSRRADETSSPQQTGASAQYLQQMYRWQSQQQAAKGAPWFDGAPQAAQQQAWAEAQAVQQAQQQQAQARTAMLGQSPSVGAAQAQAQAQGSNQLLAQIMAAASSQPQKVPYGYGGSGGEAPYYDPAMLGMGRQPPPGLPSRVGMQGLSPAQAQAMMYRGAPSSAGPGSDFPLPGQGSDMIPPGFAPRMGRMPMGMS